MSNVVSKVIGREKKPILTKEYIISQYNAVKNKIRKIPCIDDLDEERKENSSIPTIGDIVKVFGGMGGLKKELNLPVFDKYDESCLIQLLKDYCKNNKKPLYVRDFNGKKNLPNYSFYKKIIKVDSVMELYEKCSIKLSPEEKHLLSKDNFTKQETINIIKIMQSKINRPLMYDDFRSPKFGEVGVFLVKKYWGTINKMKEDLGLKIVQESMLDKVKPIDVLKTDLTKLCNEIFKIDQRRVITTKDINKCEYCLNVSSYRKYLKIEGSSLREFIESIGFKLQEEGNGLNHLFEDGEKTRSQYELDFSKLLREKLNLKYNEDYSRDVRYKEFVSDYIGMLDCDYIINYDGRKIYVEIAGMLRDGKSNFTNNITLSSRSKEKYRQHLILKENMLKENNLEYYILFPSDLREDFLLSIFQNNKQIIA